MLKKTVIVLALIFNFSPAVFSLTEEEVSKQLKCVCGCGFPDLASCSCGEWAIPAKSEIRSRIARGEDMPTILKYFVDRHDESILTSPVQEGFNRAAWIVPGVGILVAGGLVLIALYRWKKREADLVADEDGVPTPGDANKSAQDKSYLNKLHEEIYGPDQEK